MAPRWLNSGSLSLAGLPPESKLVSGRVSLLWGRPWSRDGGLDSSPACWPPDTTSVRFPLFSFTNLMAFRLFPLFGYYESCSCGYLGITVLVFVFTSLGQTPRNTVLLCVVPVFIILRNHRTPLQSGHTLLLPRQPCISDDFLRSSPALTCPFLEPS